MEKKTKGSLIIIVLIIICIIAFLAYTYSKKDAQGNQTDNVVIQNNTTNSNATLNNIVEDEVVEEDSQESEEDEEEQDQTEQVEEESNSNQETSNTNSEVTYANDEEKAIEIAKKAWGDTSGVYFAKENINSNGEYIISVSANAAVLARYTVNVRTGTCTVQYN